jgi:hypothetical protein
VPCSLEGWTRKKRRRRGDLESDEGGEGRSVKGEMNGGRGGEGRSSVGARLTLSGEGNNSEGDKRAIDVGKFPSSSSSTSNHNFTSPPTQLSTRPLLSICLTAPSPATPTPRRLLPADFCSPNFTSLNTSSSTSHTLTAYSISITVLCFTYSAVIVTSSNRPALERRFSPTFDGTSNKPLSHSPQTD